MWKQVFTIGLPCFNVVVTNPAYRARSPFSATRVRMQCQGLLKRLPWRTSSISAVLIRSDGVTATTEATTPAAIPASKLLPAVKVCVSGSSKAPRIVSKARKRVASLPIDPCICQSRFMKNMKNINVNIPQSGWSSPYIKRERPRLVPHCAQPRAGSWMQNVRKVVL